MTVLYRIDEIIKYCNQKEVLNLGFVQHSNWKDRLEKGMWLHQQIVEVAKSVEGVDLLCEEVQKINKELNQNNICHDVTKLNDLPSNNKYDVIVCGELIEHLDNPGMMLAGIKKFMHSESVLIVTTPNAFRERWVRLAWMGEESKTFLNDQHVCWYSFHTLRQLLERYGYSEICYDYYYSNSKQVSSYHTLCSPLKNGVKRLLPGMSHKISGTGVRSMGLFFVASLNDSCEGNE